LAVKEELRTAREHKNRLNYRMAAWMVPGQLLMALLLIVWPEPQEAPTLRQIVFGAIILWNVLWLAFIARFHHASPLIQGSRRWIRTHLFFTITASFMWAASGLLLASAAPLLPLTLGIVLILVTTSLVPLHLHSRWSGIISVLLPPAAVLQMLLLHDGTGFRLAALAILAHTALLIWLMLRLRLMAAAETRLTVENKELQCQHRKSQTFFAHARQLAHLAYWELDLKSGALSWSDDAYTLFGLAPGTPLSGSAVMGAIYWSDRNLFQRAIRDALAGKPAINREFRVVHPDGSIHVLRDSGEVVTDSDGEKSHMLGVMYDITGQLAAEEKSKSAFAELRRILDNMQDTYYRADPAGRLTLVSPSMTSLLGYPPDKCIGMRISDLYTATRHGASFLLDLNTHGGTLRNYQIQMRHSDGRSVWVSVNAQFIHNEKKKVIGIEGTIRDITQLRQAEQALYKERERALVTLHSIADGVITTTSEGRIQFINPTAERLLGIQAADAAGLPYLDVLKLVDSDTGQPLGDIVRQCVHYDGDTTSHTHEGQLIAHDGERYHLKINAAPMRDLLGHMVGAVLVIHDITEVMGMASQLNYQANHDILTGLKNRRVFEKRVEEAIRHAQQRNETHALFYMDLDQFKVVNDTCGHMAGDELLQQVAHLMEQKIRDADVLARLGGDEFGVLLESCPVEKALAIAEGIRSSLRDYRFHWQDKTFELGVSIGLVPIVAESGNLADVLSAADAACYVAKDSGRNRIHTYQPDDDAVAKRHGEMEWVHRLNHAFDEDRFLLYAQAVAHVGGDRMISHYEVLLRMTDERGQVIPPGAFIPAAERYNLMPAIDRWVIRKTMEMMREAQGDLVFPPVECAINLSGQSLCDEHFLEYVVDLFDETGIPCESVCFEITETAAVANLSRATRFISILKNMGCSFALDDFGSGLSSFGYLKRLPIDYLKIDGSFVRDMVVDQVDRAMVASINQIGHVMKLKTIAEFAENEGVLMALERVGVDYAQGMAIAAPRPLRDVLDQELQQLRGDSDDEIVITGVAEEASP
jgi:diguanylate cyclase (GGDEF)-like protein/PAS domain S-box-containing protein